MLNNHKQKKLWKNNHQKLQCKQNFSDLKYNKGKKISKTDSSRLLLLGPTKKATKKQARFQIHQNSFTSLMAVKQQPKRKKEKQMLLSRMENYRLPLVTV